MVSDSFDFGSRLTALLRARGMTQKALAEKCGVNARAISNWCRGRHKTTIDIAKLVKQALGCSWEELFGE